MAIIYPSQKGSALTCAELENNFREFIKRANHTGSQSSATISDLYDTVKLYDFIVALQTCCTNLTNRINTLEDDLFGQGQLATLIAQLQAQIQGIINNLESAINNSQVVQDLQECCTENTADINSLQTSIQSLLDDLADLSALLALKANRASPTFTGVPLAPTPTNDSPDQQIATVKFIKDYVDDLTGGIGDLSALLALKANIASPTFTGIPLTPTPTSNAVSTQITNVGYVTNITDELADGLALKANKASPAFTGTPTTTIPPANDDSTRIPTTGWVRDRNQELAEAIGDNGGDFRNFLKIAVPVGTIKLWPTTVAPSGWLLCNGGEYSNTSHDQLYARIGNIYGGTVGSTFKVPNLTGRFPLGKEPGVALGVLGGEELVTLAIQQMPTHGHYYSGTFETVNAGNHIHSAYVVNDSSNDGENDGFLASSDVAITGEVNGSHGYMSTNTSGISLLGANGDHQHGVSIAGDTALQGSSQAHQNMPPYIVLNYIIKTDYPF